MLIVRACIDIYVYRFFGMLTQKWNNFDARDRDTMRIDREECYCKRQGIFCEEYWKKSSSVCVFTFASAENFLLCCNFLFLFYVQVSNMWAHADESATFCTCLFAESVFGGANSFSSWSSGIITRVIASVDESSCRCWDEGAEELDVEEEEAEVTDFFFGEALSKNKKQKKRGWDFRCLPYLLCVFVFTFWRDPTRDTRADFLRFGNWRVRYRMFPNQEHILSVAQLRPRQEPRDAEETPSASSSKVIGTHDSECN